MSCVMSSQLCKGLVSPWYVMAHMPSAWTGISFRSLRAEESLWTPWSSWVFYSGAIIYLFAPAGLAPLLPQAALGSRSVWSFLQGSPAVSPSPRLKSNPRCWRWDKLRNTNNSNTGWIGLCSPDQDPTVKRVCVCTQTCLYILLKIELGRNLGKSNNLQWLCWGESSREGWGRGRQELSLQLHKIYFCFPLFWIDSHLQCQHLYLLQRGSWRII